MPKSSSHYPLLFAARESSIGFLQNASGSGQKRQKRKEKKKTAEASAMLISFPINSLASLTATNPNLREQAHLFPQIPNVRSSSQFAPSRKSSSIVRALITNTDDFEVGRFVGSYGFMNITRSFSFLSPLFCVFFAVINS